MLVLPWVLLISSLIISVAVRTTHRSNDCQSQTAQTDLAYNDDVDLEDISADCPQSAIETGSNIFVLLAGVVAIGGILGSPIWIIMLVRASSHNRRLATNSEEPPATPLHQELPNPNEPPESSRPSRWAKTIFLKLYPDSRKAGFLLLWAYEECRIPKNSRRFNSISKNGSKW